MKPECLLPRSQESAICPCSEPGFIYPVVSLTTCPFSPPKRVVFPLSVSSINLISFRASTSCFHSSSTSSHHIYIFFNNVIQKPVPIQSGPSFLVLKLSLFSLILCNTPSFITIKAFIFTSQSYSRKIGTDICG